MFGLYKGLLPPLAGFAAMNAVTFGVQGNVYRKLVPCTKNLFLSGVIAGLVQSSLVCPIELVKTRMQLQGQGETYKHLIRNKNEMLKYSNSVDCIRKIYRTGGIRACYCGMIPTLAREGPSVGLYIALYHELCKFFSKNPKDLHQLGVGYLLLAGGLAGSCSWIVTYPIDVVKSRMQADITGQYKGIQDCFQKTLHSEGFHGYFRGIITTIVRAFPVNAATLATVTLILRGGRKEMDHPFPIER